MKAPLFLVILFCIIIWSATFGYAVYAIWFKDETEMAKLGQFGDLFGALNTLFSGLALISAIYAITHQNRQHKEQEEHELEMMVRSKLENLLHELMRLKLAYLEECAAVLYQGVAWNMDKGTSNIGKPAHACGVLIILYFPSLQADFTKLNVSKDILYTHTTAPNAWSDLAAVLEGRAKFCEVIREQVVKNRNQLIYDGSRLSVAN